MPDFEIKLTTPIQLEGAKQLAEQLEKDIGKAKALGQATEELEAKLKTVNAAIENADPAAKKLEISHRELRESVRASARAFGNLGEVGLLLSGPTAAVFILIQAVEALKQHLEKQLEAAIKDQEAMEQFDASKLEAAADAAREAANAMEDFQAAQTEATSGGAAMAAAATAESNQYLAEIDAQIEASKKLNEEEEKLAEAKIQRMVDTGEISQEEGNRRKHIEQESMGQANANLDAQKERERIAEKERQLAEAKTRLPQEQHEQAATVAGAQSTAEEKKRFEDAAKEATKKAEEARAALTKRQGEVAAEAAGQGVAGFVDVAAATVGGMLPGIDATKMRKGIDAENQRGLAKQAKYTELLESRAHHLEAMVEGDARAADAAKKHADNLEKAIEEDKKLLASAPGEIESAKRIAKIHAQSASAGLQAQGRTHEEQEASEDAIEANRGVEDLARRAHTAAARLGSPGEGRVVSDLLRDIISLQQGHHEISGAHQMELESLRHEIQELRSEQSALEQRASMNRMSP